MGIPNEFYTAATLFSLSGSSTAVVVITNVIGYLIEPRDSAKIRKWLGLILSILFSLLGVFQIETQGNLVWVVAFVNGFLIYLTAVGANTVLGHTVQQNEVSQSPIRETSAFEKFSLTRFMKPWW